MKKFFSAIVFLLLGTVFQSCQEGQKDDAAVSDVASMTTLLQQARGVGSVVIQGCPVQLMQNNLWMLSNPGVEKGNFERPFPKGVNHNTLEAFYWDNVFLEINVMRQMVPDDLRANFVSTTKQFSINKCIDEFLKRNPPKETTPLQWLEHYRASVIADYFFYNRALSEQSLLAIESISAIDSVLNEKVLDGVQASPYLGLSAYWLKELKQKCKGRPGALKEIALELASIIHKLGLVNLQIDAMPSKDIAGDKFLVNPATRELILNISAPILKSDGLKKYQNYKKIADIEEGDATKVAVTKLRMFEKQAPNRAEFLEDIRRQLKVNREEAFKKYQVLQQAASCLNIGVVSGECRKSLLASTAGLTSDVMKAYDMEGFRENVKLGFYKDDLSGKNNQIWAVDQINGAHIRNDYYRNNDAANAVVYQTARGFGEVIVIALVMKRVDYLVPRAANWVKQFNRLKSSVFANMIVDTSVAAYVKSSTFINYALQSVVAAYPICKEIQSTVMGAINLEPPAVPFCRVDDESNIGPVFQRVASQSTVVRDYDACILAGALGLVANYAFDAGVANALRHAPEWMKIPVSQLPKRLLSRSNSGGAAVAAP